MNSAILTGLIIPFAGTALGSAFVFFMRREMPALLQKTLLGFASGVMLYVVVEELVPKASEGEHSNLGTIGFALGFALMMALDVLLG